MKNIITAVALNLLAAPALLAGGTTPSNPDAVGYIVQPQNGATVTSPVTVVFGVKGMGIAPAGVEKEMTGHHHLLVNRPAFGSEDQAELAAAIPADDNNLHFGGGQTETTLELAPGTHTLQLVLGDWSHIPHMNPVISEQITITVE